ncbi:MAG: hypothetical protein K0R65_2542 [Crocinitomicaceae bacterium]|nr:hypothetical protein [Crocinitomicaceae bacterium]
MIIWGLITTTLLFSPQLNAQVSVNININAQPAWGPVGYDYVEYYYLPDIGVYYNVPYNKYIYWDGGRWLWVSALPARYSYYNFYSGYKVVINEPNPYRYNQVHRVKYKKYKNHHGQQNVIRDVKGGRPAKGGWDSNLKKQAPQQKSNPQKGSPMKNQAPGKATQPKKGSSSPMKNQAPGKSTQPQKGSSSPMKNQAPSKSQPQNGSPMKKQAPAQQPNQPQKSSPMKNQAPQQPSQPQKSSPMKNQAPQSSPQKSSPQKSSPMKKQAPSQPSKGGGSPLKNSKGG